MRGREGGPKKLKGTAEEVKKKMGREGVKKEVRMLEQPLKNFNLANKRRNSDYQTTAAIASERIL